MDDPDSRIALVLVLPSLATSTEGLDIAILDCDMKDSLSRHVAIIAVMPGISREITDEWEREEMESDLDHARAELVAANDGYDSLYDDYLEALHKSSNAEERLSDVAAAFDSLIDVIVFFEPQLRQVVEAKAQPQLRETFEEWVHELHRSLIGRATRDW